MDIWSILGIEATVDTRAIKKAYVSKLKIYHPEDDPKGFQRLREAYESALRESKYIKEVKPAPVIEKFQQMEEDFIEEFESESTVYDYDEMDSDDDFISVECEFMNQVEEIYNDFFKRINVKVWRKLLENEKFWNIDTKEALNYSVLEYLMDNRHLPQCVWKLLNEYFFWDEQEKNLYEDFPEEFISFVIGEITCSVSLRYDSFKESHECDYDEFVKLREKAYTSLQNNQNESAWDFLQSAYNLFSDDPDLIRMIGTYNLRNQDIDNALKSFSRLIEISPKDADGFLNRAAILIKKGKINEAYKDYQEVLNLMPDNIEAANGVAEYYFHNNMINEAKLIYEQIIEKYPYQFEISMRLVDINVLFSEKYIAEIATNPNNDLLKFELAKIYFELNDYEESIKVIKKIAEVDSDMYLLMGRCYIENDNYRKGIENFNKALKLSEKEGKNGYEIFFYRGIAYSDNEKFNKAVNDFISAIKINPYDAKMLSDLAYAYLHEDKFEESIRLSDEAISIDHSKWVYFSVRGLGHYYAGNYKKAKEDYQIVVDDSMFFSDGWAKKGLCHLRLNENIDAAYSFIKALHGDEDTEEEVDFYLAYTYFILEKPEDAFEKIVKSLENNPEDSLDWILAGDICRALGEIEEAKEFYLKAYELNSEAFKNRKLVIFSYLCDGEYEKAFLCLNELHEAFDFEKYDEGDEWILRNLAWMSIEAGEWKACNDAFRNFERHSMKISDKATNYMIFYNSISKYQCGEYDEALESLILIEHESDLTEDVWSYMSMIYYELDNFEKAIYYAERALKSQPLNVDYQTRHKDILQYKDEISNEEYSDKRKILKAMWQAKLPIKHMDFDDLPALNIRVGDDFKMHSDINKKLTDSQLYVIALDTVSIEDGFNFTSLHGEEKTKKSIKESRKQLKNSWNVNTRAKFIAMLEEILSEDTQDKFHKASSFISALSEISQNNFLKSISKEDDNYAAYHLAKMFYKKVPPAGVIAYNYTRYIYFCRVGALADYISDEEAWERMLKIAEIIQKQYSSWREFGICSYIGNLLWVGNMSTQLINIETLFLKKLLFHKESPWGEIPWNTQLS